MFLTPENYHSVEANTEYMGSSQFKDFAGCLGEKGCEARALAKVNGDWVQKMTVPLLVGSYVDAHYEGTLPMFKANYPGICKKGGDLKSVFVKANEIISRTERDPLFSKFMSGEKQVIMEAEFFGVKWKSKIDSFHSGKAIVDLKVMKSLTKPEWVRDIGHVTFVEYWGYILQLAIYQRVVELNTGDKLPCYIAGASKEQYTNIEVIQIPQKFIDEEMMKIEDAMPRVIRVKHENVIPDLCGDCDYCIHNKVLTGPIKFSDLIPSI